MYEKHPAVEDMNNLRHMLGIGSHIPAKDWGSRNYFNAGEGHSDMPSLLRLIAAGLVRSQLTDSAGAWGVGGFWSEHRYKQVTQSTSSAEPT